jgi:hypothetical protein
MLGEETHLKHALFCHYCCCRLAVLTNLKEQLDSIGVPMLCGVDSATESKAAQGLHPTAEIWRALATSTGARSAANASANQSSHNNHGVNTQSYQSSEPQKGSQYMLVTDACDLPKHRLIARQLAALDNAPVVVCVNSTIPYSKGAALVRYDVVLFLLSAALAVCVS